MTGNGGGHSQSQCHITEHPLVNHTTTTTTAVHEPESSADSSSFTGLSALSKQVAEARQQIQSSLKFNGTCSPSSGGNPIDEAKMEVMEQQYKELCKQMKELRERVVHLELEVAESKGGSKPKAGGDSKAPAADDDDVDLFGSDNEEVIYYFVKYELTIEYRS